MLIQDTWEQIVRQSTRGVCLLQIQEPACPVVFVNPAFEELTGYPEEEALGKALLDLLGAAESSSADAVPLEAAIACGEECLATLRCRHKDGSFYWNEVATAPVRDASGMLTHVAVYHRDMTREVELAEEVEQQSARIADADRRLAALTTLDAITGTYNRRFFDDQLSMIWRIAIRAQESVAFFFVDLDRHEELAAAQGQDAADQALRGVAEALRASFQRAGDFVARFDRSRMAVLALGMKDETLEEHAATLGGRVRHLRIPHEQNTSGVVTVSVGFAVTVPKPFTYPIILRDAAWQALAAAQEAGGNYVRKGEVDEPSPFSSEDAG
jgi:diguanylate cyclase (GGDEF)-like protein/PAS domain S-box-containing protein